MKLSPYTKAVVAVVATALTTAQQVIPMSPATHDWVAVALAALGALGVYLVPNAPKEENGAPKDSP
jgi:hypothetical protein